LNGASAQRETGVQAMAAFGVSVHSLSACYIFQITHIRNNFVIIKKVRK
jgi:hypothetical protein